MYVLYVNMNYNYQKYLNYLLKYTLKLLVIEHISSFDNIIYCQSIPHLQYIKHI